MPTEPPVRDPDRTLAALLELSQASKPHDLRVGQAIVNALLLEYGPTTDLARLFYVEDRALAEALSKFAAQLRGTTPA